MIIEKIPAILEKLWNYCKYFSRYGFRNIFTESLQEANVEFENIINSRRTTASKINVTLNGVYLPISKLHNF